MLTRRAALAAVSGALSLAAIEPMLVRDPSGKDITITPGNDITVVTFISTQCPVSNDYNDRMSALYKDYAPKGIKFFFVNANSTEPASVVAEHSKSAGFPFPVYKDQNAADKLGAETTPETFVFDRSGKQIYHGYIDDARNTARVRNNGLRDAMDAAIAGKPVANPTTRAFGCTIKKARRNS
jgi:thiol-disulfide isomerase/thioredoxin